MSNLFQNLTSGLAELKNYYQGPIVSQFNDDIPIYRGAEKVKNGWSGLQVIRPLKVQRNQGIGAVSDGGTLPAIGRQGTVQAIIASKYNYLRFGVTGPMIKASQNDKGSFVRAASYELEEGYNDLKQDMNRQVSWDGTGDLARANANTAASLTLVIKGREDSEAALKFVDVNLVFDIYTSAGALVQSGVQVNSVSGTPLGSTATLTCNVPVTCSSGDVLVRSGSFGNEVQGLLTSQDGGTSTIFNVDRSTYFVYQGNQLDLSGAQVTLDKIQQLWNLGGQRGGAKYSAHYMDYGTQRMYQKLLTADKRYVNTMKGDGGFASSKETYLEFNGIPCVADKDCPQRWFMLDQSTWKNYILAEMEFCDETGSMYIAQTSSDSFEVRVRYFNNLFPEKPASNGALYNYISP